MYTGYKYAKTPTNIEIIDGTNVCFTCVSFRRSIRLNANAIENYTIHGKDTQQHEHINNKKQLRMIVYIQN